MTSHYEVLEVDKSSDYETIKKKYLQLANKYHPDKNFSNEAKEKFIQIQQAWEVLRDKSKRKEYDIQLQVIDYENKKHTGQIADIVNIDDMEYDENEQTFSSDCRCGDKYIISMEELERGFDTVNCNGCSLVIKVLCSEE